jgi:hypothetical protein
MLSHVVSCNQPVAPGFEAANLISKEPNAGWQVLSNSEAVLAFGEPVVVHSLLLSTIGENVLVELSVFSQLDGEFQVFLAASLFHTSGQYRYFRDTQLSKATRDSEVRLVKVSVRGEGGNISSFGVRFLGFNLSMSEAKDITRRFEALPAILEGETGSDHCRSLPVGEMLVSESSVVAPVVAVPVKAVSKKQAVVRPKAAAEKRPPNKRGVENNTHNNKSNVIAAAFAPSKKRVRVDIVDVDDDDDVIVEVIPKKQNLPVLTNRVATMRASPSVVETDSSNILKGVQFVISGVENPRRSELRECAVRLGAQYSANWLADVLFCNHVLLITALFLIN